ncbi:hypothetical protein HpBGD24_06560 [Helicobacter pylori]
MHKKVLLALTASLICQESLFAKEKDYTLGKVSTSGKRINPIILGKSIWVIAGLPRLRVGKMKK